MQIRHSPGISLKIYGVSQVWSAGSVFRAVQGWIGQIYIKKILIERQVCYIAAGACFTCVMVSCVYHPNSTNSSNDRASSPVCLSSWQLRRGQQIAVGVTQREEMRFQDMREAQCNGWPVSMDRAADCDRVGPIFAR